MKITKIWSPYCELLNFWVMTLCGLTGGYHNVGSTATILSVKVREAGKGATYIKVIHKNRHK